MANWYIRSANADPSSPSSYTFVGSNPPSCPGAGKICAIFAEDDTNGGPVITESLNSEMLTALSTNNDQPNVILRSAN